MEAQGVDIIDIGGQSTRPGSTRISPEAEWGRIGAVVQAVAAETQLAVSIDTFYPAVAEKALRAGAHIINDVTGFSAEMWRAVQGTDCGCVVMHPGDPDDLSGGRRDILETVRAFFEGKAAEAAQYGVERRRLCFDPGVGFGKTHAENLELIANPDALRAAGAALLMAASRKRVIAAVCGEGPAAERVAGTVAAHTAAAVFGADMVRRCRRRAWRTLSADTGDREAGHGARRKGQTDMETIRIKGLEIFAYHGVNPEEKENGQKFVLDLALSADLTRAAQSDDLKDTVNYAAVRKAVNAAFTAQKYDLIERAAQVVCDAVLAGFPQVEAVTLELKKPEAPINAVFDYVSVEMTRRRA